MGMATFTPDVTAYDPRTLADLSAGLGFSVDPDRCTVLVLPYYVHVLDKLTSDPVVQGAARVVEWARSQRIPVIASAPKPAFQIAQRGLGGRVWGLGPDEGEASERCLEWTDDVVWVHKRSLSAFYATDLEVELRRTGRDQLLVVGVYASQGIVATAFDALARDVELIVVTDAVADTSPGLHELAMRQVARSVGQVVYLDDPPQR